MTTAYHVDPPPPESWTKRKLRQFWVIFPMAIILGALMMSDLGDFMGYSPFAAHNRCELSDQDQSSVSARLYMPIAKWALRYQPSPSVALIYVDPAHDPPDLLTNVCASRVFLARLIADLTSLGAHVIAIDKYYSATACAEPEKNAVFVNAMNSSKVPVIVGQADHALPESAQGSGCLALTPRLEFSKSSKVQYGLVRLDTDVLKIPLRFPVFADPAQSSANPPPAPKQLPDSSGDTFALVTARVADPDVDVDPTVKKQLKKQIDPYTTFLDLPNITALTAMCSAETAPRADIDGQPGDELCKPWVRPVDDLDGSKLSLAGKIVVVGDLSEQDLKPFPTTQAPFPPGRRPGVFLHANYVQALLDRRFLLEIPMAITVAVLVLYVLVVYCLYWAHDGRGRGLFSAERAGLWSLALLAGIAALSFLGLVTLGYFTPLWALWGAGVFMVFRYLEATGHRRSEELLGHLAGHHHPAAHHEKAAAASKKDSDYPRNS
jgi:CHASE2 domain-containing sensor protein